MRHHWDDYCLDREGTLLTRQGQQVDVSRRILDCITHLIEQRHRVVGYDELIRKVWGHDDVTNHQLAQVVMASRRILGDDGQTQRLIRTMPGLGYRWVGAISETAAKTASLDRPAPEMRALPDAISLSVHDADGNLAQVLLHGAARPDATTETTLSMTTASTVQLQAPSLVSVSQTETPTAKSTPSKKKRLRLWMSAGLALLALTSVSLQLHDRQPFAESKQQDVVTANPLATIEDRLWRGDVDGVRTALVSLPLALAESPDAKIIEIRLDIGSDHLERAARKLAKEQAKSKAAGDVVWQAKLLTLQSLIASKKETSGPAVFKPANEAVILLESLGNRAPQTVLAEAITAQARGRVNLGQNESAIRDLVRARDILIKEKDKRIILETRWMLAFARMRTGRLSDALDEYVKIANSCQEMRQPICETDSRNIQTRLQIELLRWHDAYANSRRSMEISKSVPDTRTRMYSVRIHALVLTNMGRLREAASLLEATDSESDNNSVNVSSVSYLLASGDSERALAASAEMFVNYPPSSNPNLIFSSQEGAMLLWMIAAQDLQASARISPTPSAAQLQVLQHPQSIPGRIARGRWLWSKGMQHDAEIELRSAFDDSENKNRLLYMTLAAEPLVELLLQKNNLQAADEVIASLRGADPEHMDQDYRVTVLRLRTALVKGNISEIEDMRRRAAALAGERQMPSGV